MNKVALALAIASLVISVGTCAVGSWVAANMSNSISSERSDAWEIRRQAGRNEELSHSNASRIVDLERRMDAAHKSDEAMFRLHLAHHAGQRPRFSDEEVDQMLERARQRRQ